MELAYAKVLGQEHIWHVGESVKQCGWSKVRGERNRSRVWKRQREQVTCIHAGIVKSPTFTQTERRAIKDFEQMSDSLRLSCYRTPLASVWERY